MYNFRDAEKRVHFFVSEHDISIVNIFKLWIISLQWNIYVYNTLLILYFYYTKHFYCSLYNWINELGKGY